ncbi:MAG: hypothetical protein IJF33_03690 [Clostridia bacterium]|nr:hypothetical protein [Clostridia bacterium]
MNTIHVDFSKKLNAIKPMHCVNNGPEYKYMPDQRITNLDAYREAGIPYARNHDASICYNYGGEHIVDVHSIFTDFDADPTDPASYDFELTDEYLKMIELGGAKVFYRLGSKIEHWKKKYGTLPPRDFKKWAVICEHIIRHYTEGWADGFTMDIEYWEIWNEPDLDRDDSDHKRNWGGTKAQFFDFFEVAAKHLKAAFPHLKIGGPSICGRLDWGKEFLEEMSCRQVPLDFFSWHTYTRFPEELVKKTRRVRELLDMFGYTEAESILNEWNYISGWLPIEKFISSLKAEKGIKGASFVAAVMLALQKEPLDMLMYYDARPCAMNGMFSTDFLCECLKGYYPFPMFNTLYRSGTESESTVDDDTLFACAADGETRAVMFTRFIDEGDVEDQQVKVELRGVEHRNGVRVSVYLLDGEHDAEIIREEIFTSHDFALYLKVPNLTTYLLKIESLS